MDIDILYGKFKENRVISTDSRNITPGCMFFALKGENFNGNLFAVDALNRGASAAIVDEDIALTDSRIFRVDNVLHALQQLASHHRTMLGIPVLAITGSNGKTTTKELCRAVLSQKFNVHATEGNLNNHIGVPLTLLSIRPDCEMAIIEMGANHHGEIDRLCQIAQPDYGVITNIGKAHLEGFGSIEGVAKAKGELIRFLMENSKTIFLNAGNKWLANQVPAGYTKVVIYNSKGGLTAHDISCNPYLTLTLKNGNDTRIRTRLAGGYNAENVLAACAIGLHFDIPMEIVARAISDYQPQNSRSQVITTERNTVLMDAYNANPSSMAVAIDNFLRSTELNKMLILGEMREVGESSDAEHLQILKMLKDRRISNVFCVGKAFEKSSLSAGFHYAASVENLVKMLKDNPPEGYYIMVKGSRSNRLELVIPYL